MAKNKKKVEKQKHILPEELAEMKNLVTQSNNGHMQLGQLSMQKHRVLHALATVQDKITLFQEQMQEKYGKCEINTVDGEIQYIEDEQANS
tara:strand:+ start:359 stop:631 length:273 start_codon:yes stop_codon:yes gene_type:complete